MRQLGMLAVDKDDAGSRKMEEDHRKSGPNLTTENGL